MSTNRAARPSSAKVVPVTTSATNVSDVLQKYGCGTMPFIGTENAFYEWQLVWHTAGTPDFHGPSRKLQIPTDSQSL